MAGIYIHIPFCKQACNYCDFHFSTNLKPKTELINCIVAEIDLNKDYLGDQTLESIYFGGGTPSLLTDYELNAILEKIHATFKVNSNAEITLEANPDDISKSKIIELKNSGINRLSIGIQSFNDDNLKFMNRAHNSEHAKTCVKIAQDNGIENLTIDLIYGIPHFNHDNLHFDILTALSLNTNHISAYSLTIEDKTVFGKHVKTGKMKPIDEEFAAQQYEILVKELNAGGFEQYEISNFARNESYAVHNSNYWKQQHYLGVGPGAHSYNGISRKCNISNNNKYINYLKNNEKSYTEEILSTNDKINEYVLTTLRTKWGCDLNNILKLNPNFMNTHKHVIDKLISQNLLMLQNQIIYLSKEGKLLADRITEEFFIV